MPSSDATIGFEESLKQLEEIVNKMEQGQLSLEQSLGAFEQGVQLTRQCQSTLKQAEQRVAKLMPKDDSYELNDFTEE
jgi:exodeoxyribonuclease VII small subunit|tara:strand:- start:4784 stop:5017 length:234 start_codon:yes stop_codon:yes gene_type:complete